MAAMTTDEDLVRAHQRGAEEAFEELVDRYQKFAYRLSYRMLGGHHDAEDVSQEAFVKAHRGLAEFRGDASFRTWFTRILVNVCINRRRSSRRIPRPVESVLDAPAADAPPAVEMTELQTRLDAAIRALPEKQRLTLILRTQENYEFDQIAGVLGITPVAARMNLSLARKQIREQLSADVETR